MPRQYNDALVSTEWLAGHLNTPDVHVVDASWYMPAEGRDPRAEYEQEHIPGAVFFDIDEIADTDSPYPHMMPSGEKFASRVRDLGLGDGVRIVVYDGGPLMSASRVWWMFRAFGHKDVYVLDGGMAKWREEGRPLEDLPPHHRERHFTARADMTKCCDADEVLAAIDDPATQIVDVRSAGRFEGSEPEPRPGLRSGHIPGSLNLPFTRLLDNEGRLRAHAELEAIIAEAGIDLKKRVIASCGSGVSACVLALALHQIGHRKISVYDGSWSEWGARDDLPIAP